MASFSLKQELASLRTRLPQQFPVGSGIRSHFPAGKPTSITALRRFLFRRGPISVSAGGVSASVIVDANGDGGWALTVDVNEGIELFNQAWTVSFIFTHSDTNVGHGQSISGELGGLGGGQVDHKFKQGAAEGDPWIRENWPSAFDGAIQVSLVDSDEDVAATLVSLGLVAGFSAAAVLA